MHGVRQLINFMKPKTNYAAQYDVVSVDDVRELRERRNLDRIKTTRTGATVKPANLFSLSIVRTLALLVIAHLVALYLLLKKL